MVISKKDLISIFFQLILGILLLFVVQDIQIAFIILFIEFFLLLFRYISEGFYEHTAYIFFLFAFFTFLMGGFLLNIGNIEYFNIFSYETYMHISYSLYLCLFFSSVTYDVSYSKYQTEEVPSQEQDNIKVIRVRKSALYAFYILSIFSIIINGEKAIFVMNTTYLSYYTEYSSRLPSIFSNLAAVSEFAFYVFLGTMPQKKQCIRPIIWYLAISVMSLGYGQRNGFVMSLVFVVVYFTIRHNMGGEKWISRRVAIISILAVPFFVSALYAFNYTRSNQEIEVSGIGKQIIAFFDQQSSSSKIIGYGYKFKESIKENGVNYSLSQITNIITQNGVFRALFNTRTYSGRTAESALLGTNYGNAITYKVMPYNYLAGIGMGTSYVAEAYHDFGYIGLILVNMLYGYLLAIFQRKKYSIITNKSHPYLTGIILMGLTYILYAPRSIVFGFISQTITLTTLLSVIIIHFFSRFIHDKIDL